MRVDPSLSLRTLRAEYRAACETSNEIITAIGDADAPGSLQLGSEPPRDPALPPDQHARAASMMVGRVCRPGVRLRLMPMMADLGRLMSGDSRQPVHQVV
jgi:hypothetical protein